MSTALEIIRLFNVDAYFRDSMLKEIVLIRCANDQMELYFEKDTMRKYEIGQEKYAEKYSLYLKNIQKDESFKECFTPLLFLFQKLTHKYMPVLCVEIIVSHIKKFDIPAYNDEFAESEYAMFAHQPNKEYIFIRKGVEFIVRSTTWSQYGEPIYEVGFNYLNCRNCVLQLNIIDLMLTLEKTRK